MREDLARQPGLDPLAIRLVETVPIDWPDGCLGLPSAGGSCAQVLTTGFRLVVDSGEESYEYRTDRDGRLVRPSTQ